MSSLAFRQCFRKSNPNNNRIPTKTERELRRLEIGKTQAWKSMEIGKIAS